MNSSQKYFFELNHSRRREEKCFVVTVRNHWTGREVTMIFVLKERDPRGPDFFYGPVWLYVAWWSCHFSRVRD